MRERDSRLASNYGQSRFVSKQSLLLSHSSYVPYTKVCQMTSQRCCSFVGSRLDYCNSLYTAISEINFTKLQREQNTLARVVANHKRSDHITPVPTNLYWLPIKSRVMFNIVSLTYGIRKLGQQTHLWTSIPEYKPTLDLQSSSDDLIVTKGRRRLKE